MSKNNNTLRFQITQPKNEDADLASICKLFKSIYPKQSNKFTPEYFEWRYRYAFSEKTICVGVFNDNKRIAHAAIFFQKFKSGNLVQKIAQLGDLAIETEFRSPQITRAIFRSLAKAIEKERPHFFYTTPNSKSARLSSKLLDLKIQVSIPFSIGLSLPLIRRRQITESQISNSTFNDSHLRKIFENDSVTQTDNIHRNFDEYINKCLDPSLPHFVHQTDDGAIVTCKYEKFSVPAFMIKSILISDTQTDSYQILKRLIGSAARFHKTPIHICWGINQYLDQYLHKQKFRVKTKKNILVQVSKTENTYLPYSRLDLIDLDIY